MTLQGRGWLGFGLNHVSPGWLNVRHNADVWTKQTARQVFRPLGEPHELYAHFYEVKQQVIKKRDQTYLDMRDHYFSYETDHRHPPGGNPRHPSRIQAAVAYSLPIDTAWFQKWACYHGPYPHTPPLYHVDEDLAPILVM